MRSFLRIAAAFIRRDVLIATSYKFQFAFNLMAGLFLIAVFYFVSRMVNHDVTAQTLARYNTDYFSFVLVGVVVTGALHMGLTGFAERLRTGMTEGSLEMMFAAPARPIWIVALPSLWIFAFETIRGVLMLLVGIHIFGASISVSSTAALLLIITTTLVTYSVFGLFAAAVIMVFKRGDPINWAFAHLSTLVAGAYFPVDLLPAWLQNVATFLPMTYAYHGVRMTLLAGSGLHEVTRDVLVLGLFSVVGLPLAIAACNAATDHARREGSLGSF